MLEEEIRNTNEQMILRSLKISKRYMLAIHALLITSKILIIVSGLLSFSSTKFDYWLISFLSGSLNFLATSLLSYSTFLTLERKKMMKNLNSKLEQLEIKTKLLISETDSEKST